MILQPCGTVAAAHRHRRHGEPMCEPCREAVRVDSVDRRRRKRLARKLDLLSVRLVVDDGHRMRLPLAERRLATLELGGRGYSTVRIADRLGVSTRTVERYRARGQTMCGAT